MPIQSGDIVLLKSQVMDDVPEGGQGPTAVAVVDGASNAVFPDISELDRAGGRVNLRKLFAGVRTPDTDVYMGANVIVAEPPADPKVNVALFSTGDTFDTRAQAAARVEAYLNGGPEFPGFLYEAHIAGQRSIQLCQRTNQDPPPVGRTLLLRKGEGGASPVEQYVRITRAQVQTRTFTYEVDKDYQANIVTCDISDPLRADFPGTPANRQFQRDPAKAIVRDTVVADAASYIASVPLAQPAALGDAVIRAQSVYTQIVPNSQSETPLLDQRPGGVSLLVLATAPRAVEINERTFCQRIKIGQETRGFNFVSVLHPLPAPGTVRVIYRALGRNYDITDDGQGHLTGYGSGTINYLTGAIAATVQALPDDRSALMLYWGTQTSYTDRAGTLAWRPPEYALELAHRNVVPGSVTVSWTSGGVAKTATDAAGKLAGHATGEVLYGAGRVRIKPGAGAFLDAGGQISITYQWVATVVDSVPGLTPDASGIVNFSLSQEPVPGSLQLRWITTRAVTASAGASFSGAASEKTSTSATSDITNWYSAAGVTWSSRKVATLRTSASSQSSYSRESTTASVTSVTTQHSLTDDGAAPIGGFIDGLGTVNWVGKSVSVKVIGDYSEQSYQSNFEDAKQFETLNETSEQGAWGTVNNGAGGGGSATAKGGQHGAQAVKDAYSATSMVAEYRVGTATPQAATETITGLNPVIDLCPTTADTVVPGSVRLAWMGQVYDDYDGRLYRGRTATAPGVEAGHVDYSAGTAQITDYIVGPNPETIGVQSLWTRRRAEYVANIVFTAQLSPLKPAGIVVSVVDVTGAQLVLTSAIDGTVSGTHAHGMVDYETGQCEISFGDYVLDASLTAAEKAEWWYSAADVRADGKIWRPWRVDPSTLRYQAVAYAYLPLSADVLGLDPVRLPQDGRVPIFRPGHFVVVGHTGTVGPVTVSNAQTVDCARVRLSRVRVVGFNGLAIDTGWTADLNAGTVTFTDVTGYSQPVTIEHRIEDMALVGDVQINGDLRLTRPLTHAYPAGSYVSSALVLGDTRARVSVVYDQATWAQDWSDTPTGPAATGTYNAASYPVEVTNAGAVTERWAVRFTSATAYEVIGEHVGVIATGNTATDCAPPNPEASGAAYFTLRALGWGTGWSVGNVLRINTVGALHPVWVVRTIQPGPETVTDDKFSLLVRGDVDRP